MNGFRGVGIVVTLAVLASTAAYADPPVVTATAKYELDPQAGAGRSEAGILCLPSSSLRASDFVRSERELKALTEEAFQAVSQRYPELGGQELQIAIGLKAIRAKLCARQYGAFGMGDRRSLSGAATFVFHASAIGRGMHVGDQTHAIAVQISKASPLTLEEIAPEALRRLGELVIAQALRNRETAGS